MDTQATQKALQMPLTAALTAASKSKKRKIDVLSHEKNMFVPKNGNKITPTRKKIAVQQSLSTSPCSNLPLMTQVLAELSNENPSLRNTKITLTPEIESFLTRLTKDYVENTMKFAITLAKHRKATSITPKDLAFSIKKRNRR